MTDKIDTSKWVFDVGTEIDITGGSATISTKDWVWPKDAEIDTAAQPNVVWNQNEFCALAAYFKSNPKETSVLLYCGCSKCTPFYC